MKRLKYQITKDGKLFDQTNNKREAKALAKMGFKLFGNVFRVLDCVGEIYCIPAKIVVTELEEK